MIHDSVEIYVDDLSIYGNTFQEDMDNLQKVLEICRESNLSLIHAKCPLKHELEAFKNFKMYKEMVEKKWIQELSS